MKKLVLFAIALICAVTFMTSCDKNENSGGGENINLIGDWVYSGCDMTGTDDIDFFKFYLFKIDESKIEVYGMDKVTFTTEYSYTRKGNKITFSPAFNEKYKTANLSIAYGTGKESIRWDCGNGQVYNFDKKD